MSSEQQQRFGIIAPHPPVMVERVGGRRAHVTQSSIDAMGRAAQVLSDWAPSSLVVMSPHAPGVADAVAVDGSTHFRGSLGQFGDNQQHDWEGDPGLAASIVSALSARGVPVIERAATPSLEPGALDHGSLVPLLFLDPRERYALVVISLSWLSLALHRLIGEAVAAAADACGRRVAFIASGDLSHRLNPDAPAGFAPDAHIFDETLVDTVTAGRLADLTSIDPDLIEEAGQCGLRSFIALGGFLGPDPVPTEVLSYEGPWGVGYLVALAGAGARTHSQSPADAADTPPTHGDTEIVALARAAIESWVREGRRLAHPRLHDPLYPAHAGCFVSLHRGDALRGCIGTTEPTCDDLAHEVVTNAVHAATRDPRFPALQPAELADLDVKVDVLHEPQPCTRSDLDPREWGVIVTSGWRRGLLLPDLEAVDDIDTQISIARAKAGVAEDEPCTLERFRVDRYT